MIYCIDSNIFIWGIKKQEDQEMIDRALYLFKWMDEQKHILMIPTVVVAEILAPEPLEKHAVIMDKIAKNTIIADFDMRAASIYAHLFLNRIEELKKTANQIGVDNQKMKVDHLIIASAMAQGANCIYSHDLGIKSFGQRYLEVRELPVIPTTQFDLFGNKVIQ
jgi:predicted nucleic acid-binding protein